MKKYILSEHLNNLESIIVDHFNAQGHKFVSEKLFNYLSQQ